MSTSGSHLTLLEGDVSPATPAVPAGEEGWFAPDGDLVRYVNPTIEGVESSWTELDAREDDVYLRRGALADAVSRTGVYGRGDLKTFAGRMNVAESTVHDYLATYRRIMRLESSRRARVLLLDVRYGHLRAANGVPDTDDVTYEYFLTRASDEGWIVGRLAGEISDWRVASRNLRDDRALQERLDGQTADGTSEPGSPPNIPSDTSSDTTSDMTSDMTALMDTKDTSETPDTSQPDDPGGYDSGDPRSHPLAGIGGRSGTGGVADTRADRDREMIVGFVSWIEQHDMEIGIWASAREGAPLEFVPFDDGGEGVLESLIERYVSATGRDRWTEPCTSERG